MNSDPVLDRLQEVLADLRARTAAVELTISEVQALNRERADRPQVKRVAVNDGKVRIGRRAPPANSAPALAREILESVPGVRLHARDILSRLAMKDRLPEWDDAEANVRVALGRLARDNDDIGREKGDDGEYVYYLVAPEQSGEISELVTP